MTDIESAEEFADRVLAEYADAAAVVDIITARDAAIRAKALEEAFNWCKARCRASLIAAVSEEWLEANKREWLSGALATKGPSK